MNKFYRRTISVDNIPEKEVSGVLKMLQYDFGYIDAMTAQGYWINGEKMEFGSECRKNRYAFIVGEERSANKLEEWADPGGYAELVNTSLKKVCPEIETRIKTEVLQVVCRDTYSFK